MYLYGVLDADDASNKVSLSSIKFLAEQLDKFVKTYEREVVINDPTDRKTLERLKMISSLLNQQRYDQLILDPNFVIDFNNDADGYLPEYFPF